MSSKMEYMLDLLPDPAVALLSRSAFRARVSHLIPYRDVEGMPVPALPCLDSDLVGMPVRLITDVPHFFTAALRAAFWVYRNAAPVALAEPRHDAS
jgi:hypothetical protein